MCAEQAIVLLSRSISSLFYMVVKPNTLFFKYVAPHKIKNRNGEREKTPRTAEFAIFGAPPKKIGNLRGEGVGRSFARMRSYVTFAV